MTVIRVKAEEWYPVYVPATDGDSVLEYEVDLEVPDELAERWRRLSAEFQTVNLEIDRLIYPDA